MVCCDSISLYGSINVHGRPSDSKLLPIDYARCCSDQLNPPHKAAFCCGANVWPLLGVKRTLRGRLPLIHVKRLTQSGNEAPLFAAMHATGPLQTCYSPGQ